MPLLPLNRLCALGVSAPYQLKCEETFAPHYARVTGGRVE